MTTKETIYVITNLSANHNPENLHPQRRMPIDERLLDAKRNYVLYLTDDNHRLEVSANCLIEKDIDPVLNKVGKQHLAEWSFLLAEENGYDSRIKVIF